jgi:hypothetical protein
MHSHSHARSQWAACPLGAAAVWPSGVPRSRPPCTTPRTLALRIRATDEACPHPPPRCACRRTPTHNEKSRRLTAYDSSMYPCSNRALQRELCVYPCEYAVTRPEVARHRVSQRLILQRRQVIIDRPAAHPAPLCEVVHRVGSAVQQSHDVDQPHTPPDRLRRWVHRRPPGRR